MGIGEAGTVKDAKPQAQAQPAFPAGEVKQFNAALDHSANTENASGTQGSSNTQNTKLKTNSQQPADAGGRAPQRRANLGDVNMHKDQGLRGKGTPGALESEHLEPVALQRENMRNPATGKSPVPAGRGSAFDKAQPTVMLRKATADGKTSLDRPVIAGAKNATKTGQVPPRIANACGPEAGLARARASGFVPVGAEAAAVGVTDAKYADPAIRAFARQPVNNPLRHVTDGEIGRAIDIPLNTNTQTAGDFTSLAATNDPRAKTLFKGQYSEVASAVPPGSPKTGASVGQGTSPGASVEATPKVAKPQAGLTQAAKTEQAATTVGQGAKAETTLSQAARVEQAASRGAQVVKAESTAAKAFAGASKILKPLAPVTKVLKPLAPVAKAIGKAAGPVGAVLSVAQIVTANNRLDRTVAVADAAAGAAAFAGPEGEAFAAGYAVGGLVDKGVELASKKAVGVDLSPSNGIATTLTNNDKAVSKLWADPSKPAHTQTLGWKIADYFGL